MQMKNGRPKLSRQSLVPGGSVELSHENVLGDSQSLSVSLSSSDWRNPAADLGVQVAYTEPFYAPRTTRNVQMFNTRKMSPIFTSPVENEVPPVFIDRFGLKGWTSHCGGQDNKTEHALLLQRVNTCDENGQTVTKGTKVSRGYYADNGPPTTLTQKGTDMSLSYQHFSALDNVQFVNGNQLGRRALIQVWGASAHACVCVMCLWAGSAAWLLVRQQVGKRNGWERLGDEHVLVRGVRRRRDRAGLVGVDKAALTQLLDSAGEQPWESPPASRRTPPLHPSRERCAPVRRPVPLAC
eukprot:359198-Chlamydomonas_euryale.AAC.2